MLQTMIESTLTIGVQDAYMVGASILGGMAYIGGILIPLAGLILVASLLSFLTFKGNGTFNQESGPEPG